LPVAFCPGGKARAFVRTAQLLFLFLLWHSVTVGYPLWHLMQSNCAKQMCKANVQSNCAKQMCKANVKIKIKPLLLSCLLGYRGLPSVNTALFLCTKVE